MLAAASPSVWAMDMHTCGNQMILSGDVERGDFRLVQRTLAEHPDITVAILRNSRGGDAASGYAVGEFFREKGISTYASGYCRSSCSRMFLGGKERFFTNDFSPDQTTVGFHSNYDNAGHITPGAQSKLTQFIRKYSDGKADESLVERWVNIENRNGFAHFFHPVTLHRSDSVSLLLCNGSEGTQRWKLCEKITGYDALSMGIITSLELKRSCDADLLATRPASSSP
ncbi:MAG: hypothetical protein JWL63_3159 [Rhodocyclales bacterium]|nr:hypothetical protein [Rhodocyclales bacterium]